MTRARLIEKVIAEFLDRADNFVFYDETGLSTYDPENGSSIDVHTADLADAIDLELDHIIRETSK